MKNFLQLSAIVGLVVFSFAGTALIAEEGTEDNLRPDRPTRSMIFEDEVNGLRTVKPTKDDTWTFVTDSDLSRIQRQNPGLVGILQRWGKDGPPEDQKSSQIPQVRISWSSYESRASMRSEQPGREQVSLYNTKGLVRELQHRSKKNFKDIRDEGTLDMNLPFSRSVQGYYFEGKSEEHDLPMWRGFMVFRKGSYTWFMRIIAFGGFQRTEAKTFQKDINYILNHTKIVDPDRH